MKRLLAAACVLALLLTACGAPAAGTEDDDTLHVLATTYPVYLFTTAVTEGVEGVEVSLLVNQPVSCLHDYTLTVTDMKAVERADVVVINGAGLEDFLDDALAASGGAVIDCSAGLELLPAMGHEGHDHDTEYDPHIWMDPAYAQEMMAVIAQGLGEALYGDGWAAHGALHTNQLAAGDMLEQARQRWAEQLAPLAGAELITFHDGFQYFARAFDLTLLKAIEEEEGAEASAAEIREVAGLIGEYGIPAIFTETNGAEATARATAREPGRRGCQPDMIMSGEGTGIGPYLDAMQKNIDTIVEALG